MTFPPTGKGRRRSHKRKITQSLGCPVPYLCNISLTGLSFIIASPFLYIHRSVSCESALIYCGWRFLKYKPSCGNPGRSCIHPEVYPGDGCAFIWAASRGSIWGDIHLGCIQGRGSIWVVHQVGGVIHLGCIQGVHPGSASGSRHQSGLQIDAPAWQKYAPPPFRSMHPHPSEVCTSTLQKYAPPPYRSMHQKRDSQQADGKHHFIFQNCWRISVLFVGTLIPLF